MDWIAIKGTQTKDERDSVYLALVYAGYEVRRSRRVGYRERRRSFGLV